MDTISTHAAAASQTVIESGVLGALVMAQFALIIWLVWKLIDALNKNTSAINRFIDMLNDRPCLMGDSALQSSRVA